jgi:hypothetical protein
MCVALVTTAALNTSLADLDEFLRTLLKRELTETGFDSVEIAFEAPNREWSSRLTQPTLNLFLYELREDHRQRKAQWDGARDGSRSEARPPLWLDAAYTLTAFSTAVEDEHRLMSQAITALAAYPELPSELMPAGLASLSQQHGKLKGRIGDPDHDARPDFWLAVGGSYKLSFNYLVGLPFPSGAVFHRGPPVQSQRVVFEDLAPRGGVVERLRQRGTVLDADNAPVAGVWVALPELGQVAESDESGRFLIDGVPRGTHSVRARSADGRQVTARVQVSGEPLVIRLP